MISGNLYRRININNYNNYNNNNNCINKFNIKRYQLESIVIYILKNTPNIGLKGILTKKFYINNYKNCVINNNNNNNNHFDNIDINYHNKYIKLFKFEGDDGGGGGDNKINNKNILLNIYDKIILIIFLIINIIKILIENIIKILNNTCYINNNIKIIINLFIMQIIKIIYDLPLIGWKVKPEPGD